MRIGSLFNLITDARDVLDFLFEGVETKEQLVSRLERLKRGETVEELLACLFSLNSSAAAVLDETLEMNASMDEPDPGEDDDLSDLDTELASLDAENQNSAASPPAEVAKKDVPPST